MINWNNTFEVFPVAQKSSFSFNISINFNFWSIDITKIPSAFFLLLSTRWTGKGFIQVSEYFILFYPLRNKLVRYVKI